MIERTIDGVHKGNVRPQKIEAVKFAPVDNFGDAKKEAARVIKWLRDKGYNTTWSELRATATTTDNTGESFSTLELAFDEGNDGINIASGKWIVLYDEPQPAFYGPARRDRRLVVIGEDHVKFHFEGLVDA